MNRDRPERSGRGFRTGRFCRLALAVAWIAASASLCVVSTRADEPKPGGTAPAAEAVEFFEARIRPILVERCVKCHGPRKQSSGLRLDSRAAALKGGDTGPAVVPAKPEESLIVQAVSYRHDELKMPPNGKLADADVQFLTRWVALGAPWPADSARNAAMSPSAAAPGHWAFQPLRAVPPPRVKDRGWGSLPIDAFIMTRLEAAGIAPSPPAQKRALIRRATIDLWGIPPTADEVEAFEADTSPAAFACVVDRLLASPRYGERWGRHWLDVARYADTKGYVFTQERRYPYAFTYRDYVINAFNADLPYDRFIVQQLAADQLPQAGDTRPLAAMGFLTVGRRFLLDQNEIIDDRIDVVSRGLLGLTVTCARCHDHKFDPIPTDDYYSLYGVFASSTEPADLPALDWPGAPKAARSADFLRKLEAAKQKRDAYIAARRDELQKDFSARFSQYLKAGYDLGFDGRSRRLDERARADKLDARRLRGAMMLWKRHLDAPATAHDPVLAPWHAFAALSREGFIGKAVEVRRGLTHPKDAKAAPIHPLVARVVLGDSPPSSMAEVVARYVSLFGQLETRQKELVARAPGKVAPTLSEPEWESLRQALYKSDGLLAVADDPRSLFLNQTQRGQLERLNGAIDRLNASDSSAPARAMVLNDVPRPVEPHVFLRGNPRQPGKVVPRRFLHVLAGPEPPPFRKGSGRLELAQAIADARNPLTARVLVNRVWHWHFGKGLVTTPSDFGLRSDPPSHPELLDHLAAGFLADGWSIKALHRRIMLSRTYQQSSAPRSDGALKDPENRLVWRFSPQRLDFEAMRDAILAVSGDLDSTIGGRPVAITEAPFSTRRTVYGFIDRQNLDGLYRTFDFAVPDATSPRRFVTTVPQQALFLMNSPFLHERARRLSSTIGQDASADVSDGIRRLYRRVLSRPPDADELALAADFLRRDAGPSAPRLDGWKQLMAGKVGGSLADPPLSPWEQLAQVLLLTNEFMFME
jgi:hypothetical protein